MPRPDHPALYDSPAIMVAVAYAAQQAGDRETVRIVLAELAERYGIRLTFARLRPAQFTGQQLAT